ncbi:MAG: pirin family protein [Gammaproteobacteria bacterium]|nr:pirin family protein [Gammaproteobacteria bacterium]
MEILHRDDLPLGGFAGVRERRLIMDAKLYREGTEPGTWPGLESLVYLADARFVPKGRTGLHRHHDIDVISVMVEGRISHAGSLEHGQEMKADDVQVQRAGEEGFAHDEINPDDGENRMLQLWALPESTGGPAAYKFYRPRRGGLTRVYGGRENQDETFSSHTLIEIGLLDAGQGISVKGPFLAYVSRGKGICNGEAVTDGDLVRGEDLAFDASDDAQLIVVHTMG